MRMLSFFGLMVCGMLVSGGAVYGQGDCSDAAILGVRGGWTKHPGPGSGRTYKDGAAIYRYTDSIGRIFQAFYPEPKGMQARWYPLISTNDPIVPGGPTAWVFNSQYFCWYCNVHVHKLMLGDETGTDVDVFVNSLEQLLGDQVRRAAVMVDGAPVYMLPDKVGEWKGYAMYALPAWGPTGRCVVLARGGASAGTMPWKLVTQEQYLKGVRAFIQKTSAGSQGKLLEAFDAQIKVIDDYLHSVPAEQLQQPAVLPRQRRSLFDGSFSTLAAHGQAMVMVDADYFDRRLPAYRPQFMVLFWRVERNAAAEYFRQRLEGEFPVEKLQAMIAGDAAGAAVKR